MEGAVPEGLPQTLAVVVMWCALRWPMKCPMRWSSGWWRAHRTSSPKTSIAFQGPLGDSDGDLMSRSRSPCAELKDEPHLGRTALGAVQAQKSHLETARFKPEGVPEQSSR